MWIIPCVSGQVVGQTDSTQPPAPRASLPVSLPARNLPAPVSWGARDSTLMRADSGQVLLFGEAWVAMDDIRLEADHIVFYRAEDKACAWGRRDSSGAWIGRPVLQQGDQSFEQESLCFDLKTRRGISTHAVTVQGEAYFHAGVAKRQADERIHVAHGKFTTCDAPNPHFHFHLQRAILIPGEKIVTGPFYLKFRKIPTPLALPFGWFPTAPEKRSHGLLMPGYGDGRELGFFLKDLGYYFPIGPYADMRMLADVYTGGSWAVRQITRYNVRYRGSGDLNLSYQSRRLGYTGSSNLSIDRTFFVRWNHAQDPKSHPLSRFNAAVNFGSSNNFQNNLSSSQEEYLSNTFQSNVQWSRTFRGKPWSLAASARHSQNSRTGLVDVTLPAVTLNLARTSMAQLLGLPTGHRKLWSEVAVAGSSRFEQTFSATDSVLQRRDWDQVEMRHGFKHNLTASTALRLGFVSITPQATYNEYWSFRSIDARAVESSPGTWELDRDTLSGWQTTRDWRISADASTRFYGTFNRRPDRRVTAIRHVLSPSVGLAYNPEQTRTRRLEAGEGELTFNPFSINRFQPLDIAAAGAINFSLSQNLEAKVRDRETDETRKVKLIDNLVTSFQYNMLADSLRFSDIQTRAFTTLFDRVTVNLTATHSLYDRDAQGRRIDRVLTLAEGGPRLTRLSAAWGLPVQSASDASIPWNARFDYTTQLNRVWVPATARDTTILDQGFVFRGGVRLWDRWKLDVQSGYDLVAREFTPSQINLLWDLHCWELNFQWIPNGFRQSFMLRLNIKASMLRDLKIEARGSDGRIIF